MSAINKISKLTEQQTVKFIKDIALNWHYNGYGPKPESDRKTNGFFLSCREKIDKKDDFHIHLVGNLGKYHPCQWSVKEKGRKRIWYTVNFNSDPRSVSTMIYSKSGFNKHKDCKKYPKYKS